MFFTFCCVLATVLHVCVGREKFCVAAVLLPSAFVHLCSSASKQVTTFCHIYYASSASFSSCANVSICVLSYTKKLGGIR